MTQVWQKKTHFFWFGLSISALFFFSLPKNIENQLHQRLFSLFWGSGNFSLKRTVSAPPERQLAFLNQEVKHLKNILSEEMQLESEIKHAFDEGVFENKKKSYQVLFQKKLESIPARVLFLFPSRVSRCFWIDVGRETNDALGVDMIQEGSPVIIANTLVGIIDLVGKRESRVKHIQDPTFLVAALSQRKDQVFAKGYVEGSLDEGYLFGEGFNADFDDEFSEKRDLRTGRRQHALSDSTVPIVMQKDLLLTSGLDGLFPKGLEIGEVIQVPSLKEGDVAYQLTVKSFAPLAGLETVFVLPPLLSKEG